LKAMNDPKDAPVRYDDEANVEPGASAVERSGSFSNTADVAARPPTLEQFEQFMRAARRLAERPLLPRHVEPVPPRVADQLRRRGSGE